MSDTLLGLIPETDIFTIILSYLNEIYHVKTSENLVVLELISYDQYTSHWYKLCTELEMPTFGLPFVHGVDYGGIYLVIAS